MKNKKILIILALALVALGLSACGGNQAQPVSWPGLELDGDTLYISYNQVLYAINPDNGVEQWRYPEKASKTTFFAPVVPEAGSLILAGYDNKLYSLDAAAEGSGDPEWIYKVARNRFIANPVVLNGTIYAANADGAIHAVDAQGEAVEGFEFETDYPLWASPVVDGDTLYQVSQHGEVYALSAADGSIMWENDLGNSIVSSPALVDGYLYIANMLGGIRVLDSQNGNEVLTFDSVGWVWETPMVQDGVMYFGDLEGNLYAVSTEDASLVWDTKLDSAIVAAPVMLGEKLFIGTTEGSIYSIDLEGSAVKVYSLEGQFYGTPLVLEDALVFPVVGNDMIALALDADGHEVWTFVPNKK